MANKASKFKIVFIGDQAVGKTSIITRFVYESIPDNHQPTIGIDFLSKCISIDGKTVRLQLWDTAGQERFRSLIPSYIRDSHAAVLCFDVTSIEFKISPQDQTSFANISRWLEYVREERGTDVITVLIANKIDMAEDRVVTQSEGEKYAQEQDMLYFEVSAKEGTGVQKTFKALTQQLLGPEVKDEEQTQLTQSQSQQQQPIQLSRQVEQTPQDQNQCAC